MWELLEEQTMNEGAYTITTYIAPEDLDPRDELDEEIVAGINSGLYSWFMVKVVASKCGVELGETYLGGCCYAHVTDFLGCDYWSDMAGEAIEIAEKKLAELRA